MKDTYTAISLLHTQVDSWQWRAAHSFKEIDKALARDDLAPHPDDVAGLRLAMMMDALVLRKLAAEIDARRADLERDAAQYLGVAVALSYPAAAE